MSELERLDESQRQAATARVNTVVTAGAGTGKTTVLASRYAHLVIDQKIPVRSILALTFTRKAAAEMYERIYQNLAESDSPWAMEQRADFGQARISTLDSFCAEIVRQGTGEYGYSPDFLIDDAKCADIVSSVAQRFVLDKLDDPGIRAMLESYQLNDVIQTFFAQIGSTHVTPIALREDFFSPMGKSLKDLYARELAARMQSLSETCNQIRAHGLNPGDKRPDCLAAIEAAQRYLDEEGQSAQSLEPQLRSLSTLQMKSYGRNPIESAVKDCAKRAREAAIILLDFAAYERLLPAHARLLGTLDEFAREVAEAKRRADLMNFKDLGACAVHLLMIRKDLRQKWKSSIRKIMIDEFQDDNSLQRDLLYLLSESLSRTSEGIPSAQDLEDGKLFFVGDEKQSIYRFRGADVSVFKSLARELGSRKEEGIGSDIALSTNYRSSAALIDFFNLIFPTIMQADPEAPAGMDIYEATYSPMCPGPLAAARTEFASRIQLTSIGEETDDEAEDSPELLEKDDALAFEVARTIRSLKGNLPLRGSAAAYSDFAILLRTTTHQHRIEKFLRLLDIPFESENPRGLFRESPASDIYNILSLEENPNDKAAFAAVLRSPLCRMSDEAFVSLLSLERDFLSNSRQLNLRSEDSEALERAYVFLDSLRKSAGSKPVSDMVSIIWHKGGLAKALESRTESLPFLEHFDFIFQLAAQIDAQGGGIVDFLDLLKPLLNLEEDQIELDHVPRRSAGGVRIMTIHKAKGLQFPIVILPWVENTGVSRRSQALWQMLPEGLAIDVKPHDVPGATSKNIFFDMAREREAVMARAELKRLFYVACTRAEDHLLFFGKTPRRQDKAGTSFLSFLDPEKITTRVALRASRKEAFGLAVKPSVPLLNVSRPEMAEDAPALPGRITATTINEFAYRNCQADLPMPLFKKETQTLSHSGSNVDTSIPPDVFGTLCHEVLEYAVAHKSTDGYFPKNPARADLDRRSYDAAVLEARAYAQAFLDSPFWTSMSREARVQTEKPFLLNLENLVIDGRMDLFIETKDTISIIDFKSDARLLPERYAIQLQIYKLAAAGLRPGKKARTALYDLRRGELLWCESPILEQKLFEIAIKALRDDGAEKEIP